MVKKNKKKHVIIPYEIKKRELDANLLLSSDLIKKGYVVYIGNKQRINSNLNFFPQSIFLLKSLGPRNFNYLKKVKSLGHKITCLDVEGVNYLEKIKLKNRASNENLNLIDYFFCWGKKMQNDMSVLFPNFKKKFVLTGHPRIEILKEKNINFYKQEAAEIKKKFNNFLLFTTFFPTYNFFDQSKSREEIRKLFGNDTKIGKRLQLHHKKNFYNFTKLIQILQKNFSNLKFIIRPHPVEDKNYWINKFKKYQNVQVVVDSQSTCAWIMASDLLISCNCTTQIESFFMNRMSINYMPYRDRLAQYELPVNCSLDLKKTYQVIKIIKNQQYNITNYKKKNIKKISNIIHNFHKINSNTEIIKYFEKINLSSKKVNYNLLFFYLKKIKRVIYLLIKFFLKQEQFQKILDHKADTVSKYELTSKLNKLINKSIKFKIVEVIPDIFMIKNEEK